MPKKKATWLPKYDLKKKFTTLSGSTYFSSGNPEDHLILWARPATQDPVPLTAIDSALGTHVVSFEGSPSSTDENQVTKTSPFEGLSLSNVKSPVRFPQSSTAFVQVADADDLSFGDGTEGGDTSFSMAAWMLFTSASASSYILSKSAEYEFKYKDGALSGSVTDVSAGAQLSFRAPLSGAVNSNKWHHLAFTYNAVATKTARGKLYLDGLFVSGTCTLTGTYLGMEPSANALNIAENKNNQPIEFFDTAIWSGKVLSSEDINALYNFRSGLNRTATKERVYVTSTGITSLPPRPYLSMIDNSTGSYPTIPRNGDLRIGRGRGLHKSSSVALAAVSAFNDTNVLDFQQIGKGTSPLVGNITLGTQLPSNSQYSGTLVSSVNTVPDLTLEQGASANTNVVPGISDARVTFTPGDNYFPYKEDKQFALGRIGNVTPLKDGGYSYSGVSAPDPFYSTGTLPNIVPGMSNPLWDKSKIEIDVNPRQESEIFWSTGSADSPVGSGVSYYNFDLKKWEMIRCAVTGSDVDYIHPSRVFFTSSALMMSPPINDTGYGESKYQEGSIVGAAGFPSSHQFNATSSQLLSMKNFITYPFVVEKIVYEFSASFPGPTSFGTNAVNMNPVANFGIMNQFKNSKNLNSRAVTKTSIGTNGVDGTTDNTIDAIRKITKSRDLISYGYSRIVNGSSTPLWQAYKNRYAKKPISAYPSDKARDGVDLLINGYDFGSQWYNEGVTGSFILSMSANVPTFSETLAKHSTLSKGGRLNPDGDSSIRILDYRGAGRSGLAFATEGNLFSSGRSISRSVIGSELSRSVDNAGSQGYQSKLYKYLRKDAPYILMPEDELCFYWGFQNWPDSEGDYPDITEQTISKSKLVLPPGTGRIVLYGSTLREGQEIDMGLNQNLTSLNVHEDIQSSDPKSTPYCIDQYDVEYYTMFSGSYIDNAFQEFNARNPSIGSARLGSGSKRNSVVGGLAGTTGSILRGVRFPDPNERYLDSLFPDPSVIAKANGISFLQSNSNEIVDNSSAILNTFGFYPLGNIDSSVVSSPDKVWPRSYPFDSRYGGNNVERVASLNAQSIKTDFTSTAVEKFETKKLSTVFGRKYGDLGGSIEDATRIYANINYVGTTKAVALSGSNQAKSFLKGFYGIGDSADSNLPKVVKNVRTTYRAQTFVGEDVEIRGFKYGLISSLPTYTSCIFRRDRFGQVRDMLEQRPITAIEKYSFLGQDGEDLNVGGQGSACVKVKFKKFVAISNKEVQLQGFDKTDLTQIENNKVGPRGLWNSTANIDSFSRTSRPFYDSVPLNLSGSVSPDNTDASLLFDLGGFTGSPGL